MSMRRRNSKDFAAMSSGATRARPGGRSARVVKDVLAAALTAFAESGYAGLSVEDVAARAGVNKTTVYRRWPRKLDLVSDAIDFAIRVGRRSDPSYVERELVESTQWLVASAAMLSGKRTPSSPEELAGQMFVTGGSARGMARLSPVLRFRTDDLEAAFAAVRAGLGFGVLPRWLVARSVQEGTLLRVLPDLPLPSPSIVVVYPRRLRKAARKLLERLEHHLIAEVKLHEP